MTESTPLQLYQCTRFGNSESEDGPDGDDTNMLVRANSHTEAAEIADLILGTMPTECPGGRRSVQPYCHRVYHIGIDVSSSNTPEMALSPWIGGSFDYHSKYTMWCRDKTFGNLNWLTKEEMYGDNIK